MMYLDESTVKALTAIAALASAATALVAVVVGPLIQYRIAKRQAADNISAKRQSWIDELRKDSAKYLTWLARIEGMPSAAPNQQKERMKAEAIVTELAARIKLRLNPNEEEHDELIRLMGNLRKLRSVHYAEETTEELDTRRIDFAAASNKIVSHLQVILKKEWERIKHGT